MGDQMMKAQLRTRKASGLKEIIAQGYLAEDLKGKKITQGYETQGLEETNSSRL